MIAYSLDLETKNVNRDLPWDVCQASIRSEDGLNITNYIQPQHTPYELWPKLGIPVPILETAPTLDQWARHAKAVLTGKTVLVWNAEHEKAYLPFLTEQNANGRPICDVQDLMWWASPLVTKEWSRKHGTWKFAKMTAAAEEFRLTYDDPGPHDAGADASMALKIYKKLNQVIPEWKLREESAGLRLVWDDIHAQDLNCDVDGHIPF